MSVVMLSICVQTRCTVAIYCATWNANITADNRLLYLCMYFCHCVLSKMPHSNLSRVPQSESKQYWHAYVPVCGFSVCCVGCSEVLPVALTAAPYSLPRSGLPSAIAVTSCQAWAASTLSTFKRREGWRTLSACQVRKGNTKALQSSSCVSLVTFSFVWILVAACCMYARTVRMHGCHGKHH